MKAIDLFSGLGGFTCGARMAGLDVVWAANHFRPAIDTHALNHPETFHVCQDLHQANFHEVPDHDIALASSACQGHTHARGKERPHHDTSRATAWAVIGCLEAKRPAGFVLENVTAFANWSLFPAWQHAANLLGYTLTINERDAADYGVPQNRVRLFIIGTRSRAPFVLSRPRPAHVAFSTILDEAAGAWSPLRSKCEATRSRARNGRRVFGSRFVMPYYSSGSGRTGRSIERPLGTVTTKDRWALVDGDKMRMLNVTEYRRAMGFPADYQLPQSATLAKHLLGNAVCPPQVAAVLAEVMNRI